MLTPERTASLGLLFMLFVLGCSSIKPPPLPAAERPRVEEPTQVQIYVNTDATCRAGGIRVRVMVGESANLVLPAGWTHLTCSSDGHSDATADVEAIAGRTTPVTLDLKPSTLPEAGTVKIEPRCGLAFIYVPAGSFHMGCEPRDLACKSDEEPGQREAVNAFWMGRTDVTMAAYKKCVDDRRCPAAETGGSCTYGTNQSDHPINCVDKEEASAFCAWIGGHLPTAQEWEYAAKGGENRVYPWGAQEPDQQLAKYASRDGTAPVGDHPAGASRWGLLDMAGNVWQWTQSDYGPGVAELRGGGWADPAKDLRASNRNWHPPADRRTDIGFRCLL